MEFPRRVFDGEGVKADVDFGPTLMLNRNRCILCTRCVRFMKEIDTDAQISIVDRGGGSEIATFQEEGVHSILSGNLMDVCPVGAITTRDYRFKSRPWDNPDAVDTICTLCSKGCNTTAWIKAKPEWAKGARLVRMTPRLNHDVNGYWMCDIGRFQYHWIESEDRLRKPLVRGADGLHAPAAWDAALTAIGTAAKAHAPDGFTFLASAHASNEELFVIERLASAIALSWPYNEKKQPARAKFKVPPVDAPNVSGARDLGLPTGAGNAGAPDVTALRADIDGGRVRALYVFDPGPDGSIGDVSWVIEARRSGALQLLVVPRRTADRAGTRGGRRLAGLRVGGEGIDVHERPGARAGRGQGVRCARARRATTPTSSWPWPGRPGRQCRSRRWRRCDRARGSACRQSRLRRHRRHPVLAPRQRPQLAAGVEPVRAVEVGLHVPGRAAGQVRLDAAAQFRPA